MANYQLYRTTTLGVTLKETLDEMISQGALTKQAASKVWSEFDRSINLALDKRINKKVQFTGKLSTYRFCDNVWTLVLKDFHVKDTNQNQHNTAALTTQMPRADKVKFVACDGKSAGQS
jgi:transcription initiation factor TFIIA small subunit